MRWHLVPIRPSGTKKTYLVYQLVLNRLPRSGAWCGHLVPVGDTNWYLVFSLFFI